MYVPRFYETTYHENGTIASFRPTEEGIPARIRKELVTDMTDSFYPMKPVVPYIKVRTESFWRFREAVSAAVVSVRQDSCIVPSEKGMWKF